MSRIILNPDLSVIVSTYNSENYIRDCLKSIVVQDKVNYEVIVIDGGSTDNTITIIKEFTENYGFIKLFEFDRLSFPDALNLGLGELASAHIITFINSDDFYVDYCFQRILDIFYSDKSIDIVQSEGYYVNESGMFLSNYPSKKLDVESFILTASSDVLQPAMFFKRDLFKRVGGISEGFKCLVDLNLWSKMLLLNPRVYFAKGLFVAAYRLHSSSFTVSGKDKFIHDLILHTETFEILDIDLRRKFLFFNYLRIINYYRELRMRKLALDYLIKSIKCFRFSYLFEYKKIYRYFQLIFIIFIFQRWSK